MEVHPEGKGLGGLEEEVVEVRAILELLLTRMLILLVLLWVELEAGEVGILVAIQEVAS